MSTRSAGPVLAVFIRAHFAGVVVLNDGAPLYVHRRRVGSCRRPQALRELTRLVSDLAADYGAVTIIVEPTIGLGLLSHNPRLQLRAMTLAEVKERLLGTSKATQQVLCAHVLEENPQLDRFVGRTLNAAFLCGDRWRVVVPLSAAFALAGAS